MMLAWFNSSEMTASSGPRQRLEEAAVGVEAGGVEDRVLGAEKPADLCFELLVNLLCAADETDACHAVSPAIERLVGGGNHRRMVGQAQVVVGTEVQYGFLFKHAYPGTLRRGNYPFILEKASFTDLLKLAKQIIFHQVEHRSIPCVYRL